MLDGRGGPDSYEGGGGIDLADYSQRSRSLVVTLDDQPGDGEKLENDNVAASVEDVAGGSGGDRLVGTPAANRLEGAGGNDRLDGDTGSDVLAGGEGIDTASYAGRNFAVSMTLDGVSNDGAANEHDQIGADIENLTGGKAGDLLEGDARDNVLDGGLGSDEMNGGDGVDTVTYADRTESVFISMGALASGGSGESDLLGADVERGIGGSGPDTMFNIVGVGQEFIGNAGDDQIAAGNTGARVDAGAGHDFVSGGGTVIGGDGDDTLFSFDGDDELDGGDGNDQLNGGVGDDALRGGPGDDKLDIENNALPNPGADDLQGGGGTDATQYFRFEDLTVRLNDQPDDGAAGEGENVHSDIEVVTAGSGDDILVGTNGAETLNGGVGDDSIDGRGGADALNGGPDADDIEAFDLTADTITCGGQAGDSVVFDEGLDVFPLNDC